MKTKNKVFFGHLFYLKWMLSFVLIAVLLLNFAAGVRGEHTPVDPITRAELIIEYDHDLTSSSERYILTGDEYWKNNYDAMAYLKKRFTEGDATGDFLKSIIEVRE